MRKITLLLFALMCAVGVNSVKAEETVSLGLDLSNAQKLNNTNLGKDPILPTADAVKNFFSTKSAGMYCGISNGSGETSWYGDLKDNSVGETVGFSFCGRQGYGGESVSQVYMIDGTVSSLSVSFKLTIGGEYRFFLYLESYIRGSRMSGFKSQ